MTVRSRFIAVLFILVFGLATAQTPPAKLGPLAFNTDLAAPASIYQQDGVIVIDFAEGKRQAHNCTLEKLESPQGEILAFSTVSELSNGLTLRYDISFAAAGSGGVEGFLEGLLFSNQQLYKVTGHTQTELETPDPTFCIDVFESLEALPAE